MPDTNYEANLAARANLFKALGHPATLLILNLAKIKPRHGQELAEILRLNPATRLARWTVARPPTALPLLSSSFTRSSPLVT